MRRDGGKPDDHPSAGAGGGAGDKRDAGTAGSSGGSLDASEPSPDASGLEPEGGVGTDAATDTDAAIGMDAATDMDAAIDMDAATGMDAASDAGVPGEDAAPDSAIGTDAAEPDAAADASVDAATDSSLPDPVCDTTVAPDLSGLGLVPMNTGAGLSSLASAAQPPGSDDWYLVEQRGRIWILRGGALLPTPFLDLSAEVPVVNAGYEDRGLVSIAFPPDYATSGLFYVTITPTGGAYTDHDLVLEFQRDSEDADLADVATRKTLVELVGSNTTHYLRNIHNFGRLAFGPDGFLYVASGDGGGVSCNDVEPGAPQDIGSAFGKILRLDPSAPAPYAAAGNPFAGDGDPRVFHYGLRNPFNFSFDRANADMYIGDVGQSSYEEFDRAPAGAAGLNFGWPWYQGRTATCPSRPLRPGSTATSPIFVADRRSVGCSGQFCDWQASISGVVYRGDAIPQLEGVYLFGDYVGRRMVALRQCGDDTSPHAIIRKRCDASYPDEDCFAALQGTPAVGDLTAIVEGNDGEIYLVANRSRLLKVVSAD